MEARTVHFLAWCLYSRVSELHKENVRFRRGAAAQLDGASPGLKIVKLAAGAILGELEGVILTPEVQKKLVANHPDRAPAFRERVQAFVAESQRLLSPCRLCLLGSRAPGLSLIDRYELAHRTGQLFVVRFACGAWSLEELRSRVKELPALTGNAELIAPFVKNEFRERLSPSPREREEVTQVLATDLGNLLRLEVERCREAARRVDFPDAASDCVRVSLEAILHIAHAYDRVPPIRQLVAQADRACRAILPPALENAATQAYLEEITKLSR